MRIGKLLLFLRIGFYTFYIPYLEKRNGLKELFIILSKNGAPAVSARPLAKADKKPYYYDKSTIRRYVHAWMRIKGLFIAQHCWSRTLLLYKFLKSAGYNVMIYTGIRKDSIDNISIIGHSWITIDGDVFDDRSDVAEAYYVTFSYP